jgi:hypothetical protein
MKITGEKARTHLSHRTLCNVSYILSHVMYLATGIYKCRMQATQACKMGSKGSAAPADQGTALARQAAVAFAVAIRWLEGSAAAAAVMTATLMCASHQVPMGAANHFERRRQA